MEYQMELAEANFVNPRINMLRKRIAGDCAEIKKDICRRVNVKDADFADDYTAELHEINRLIIGIDIEDVREFIKAVKGRVSQKN